MLDSTCFNLVDAGGSMQGDDAGGTIVTFSFDEQRDIGVAISLMGLCLPIKVNTLPAVLFTGLILDCAATYT